MIIVWAVGSIVFSMLLFFVFLCSLHWIVAAIGLKFTVTRFMVVLLLFAIMSNILNKIKQYGLSRFSVRMLCFPEESFTQAFKNSVFSIKQIKTMKKLFDDTLEPEDERVVSLEKDLETGEQPEDQQLEESAQSSAKQQASKRIKSSGEISIVRRGQEDCLAAYIFKRDTDKSFNQAMAEGYTILNTLNYDEKLNTVEVMCNIVSFVVATVLIFWAVAGVKFSIMNLMFLLLVGKLLNFCVIEGIVRPLMMSEVIKMFVGVEWSEELEESLNSLIETNEELKKLAGKEQ